MKTKKKKNKHRDGEGDREEERKKKTKRKRERGSKIYEGTTKYVFDYEFFEVLNDAIN